MIDVLFLTVGTDATFTENDFTLTLIGYIFMRLAMVAQWLRASRSGGAPGHAALWYAGGITIVQCLWAGWYFLEVPHKVALFVLLALVEISVPLIAENKGRTTWHPHHITERYGCFTLILLGESLLATSNSVIEALSAGDHALEIFRLGLVAFTIIASAWWIYFYPPHHMSITSFGKSIRYGYAHYFVFAAAGALSAGIEAELSLLLGDSSLSSAQTSFVLTVPVCIFMLGIWLVAIRDQAPRAVNIALPLGALAVLADPILPIPGLWTSIVMLAVVAVLVRFPAD